MGKMKKITISLPAELVSFTDKMAEESNRNRSQVISKCLKELAEEREKEFLKEGYLAMAEEHKITAALFQSAQTENWPEWKEE
jgi:metal-responsive CopG/Arc/MetJ family transcriptional regulator